MPANNNHTDYLTPSGLEMDPLRKLRWQCRRGLLELDVLLTTFLDHHYSQLSSSDQAKFIQLLQCSDQQLLYWLTNQTTPPAELLEILTAIQQVKIVV